MYPPAVGVFVRARPLFLCSSFRIAPLDRNPDVKKIQIEGVEGGNHSLPRPYPLPPLLAFAAPRRPLCGVPDFGNCADRNNNNESNTLLIVLPVFLLEEEDCCQA